MHQDPNPAVSKNLQSTKSKVRKQKAKRSSLLSTMFFFFIGGVEPTVRKTLQPSAVPCLRCGEPADVVEIANTFKAFFIPLWSFGDTTEAVRCTRCGYLLPRETYETLKIRSIASSSANPSCTCAYCGAKMESGWRFCPVCGNDS